MLSLRSRVEVGFGLYVSSQYEGRIMAPGMFKAKSRQDPWSNHSGLYSVPQAP